jgi:hypothetical protein
MVGGTYRASPQRSHNGETDSCATLALIFQPHPTPLHGVKKKSPSIHSVGTYPSPSTPTTPKSLIAPHPASAPTPNSLASHRPNAHTCTPRRPSSEHPPYMSALQFAQGPCTTSQPRHCASRQSTHWVGILSWVPPCSRDVHRHESEAEAKGGGIAESQILCLEEKTRKTK